MAYSGPVVDVHTHIFNAHCVPLKGILKEKGVRFPFNHVIAKFLNQLTGKLDFHRDGGEEGFQSLALSFDGSDASIDVTGNALTAISAINIVNRLYADNKLKALFNIRASNRMRIMWH